MKSQGSTVAGTWASKRCRDLISQLSQARLLAGSTGMAEPGHVRQMQGGHVRRQWLVVLLEPGHPGSGAGCGWGLVVQGPAAAAAQAFRLARRLLEAGSGSLAWQSLAMEGGRRAGL